MTVVIVMGTAMTTVEMEMETETVIPVDTGTVMPMAPAAVAETVATRRVTATTDITEP